MTIVTMKSQNFAVLALQFFYHIIWTNINYNYIIPKRGDAHFQPDVENGAYPADGQRESPRRIFLQTHYYHCADTYLLLPESGREDVLPVGIHLGIRFVGSFVVHVDLGAGHVIHVAETERAREEQLLCAFHQREIGGLLRQMPCPSENIRRHCRYRGRGRSVDVYFVGDGIPAPVE